jgi:hypothetical protein
MGQRVVWRQQRCGTNGSHGVECSGQHHQLGGVPARHQQQLHSDSLIGGVGILVGASRKLPIPQLHSNQPVGTDSHVDHWWSCDNVLAVDHRRAGHTSISQLGYQCVRWQCGVLLFDQCSIAVRQHHVQRLPSVGWQHSRSHTNLETWNRVGHRVSDSSGHHW